MAKYRISTPDGSKYEITAPDNATSEEVLAYAKANHKMTPAYDTSNKGREDRINSIQDPMIEGAKAGLRAALPSSEYNQPLAPTSDNPVVGGVQAALQTLRDPTRLSSSISQPGQVAGEKVEEATGSKLAGFATSVALDPQTYTGIGGAASKGISKGISKFSDLINDGLAAMSKWKLGASVPEKAAEVAKKAKFKLPAGTPEEIELGVERLQRVLNETKDMAGEVLNKAKSEIGIPTTIAEKEKSLMMYGNIYGLDASINDGTKAMLAAKTPEELASKIAEFKALNQGQALDPKLTARVASALQDKIKSFVDFNKPGTEIEGLLKKQYNDLGDVVLNNAVDLKSAKGEMAKALEVFNDLKRQLADPDKSGKAEQYLRNLFKSKSAASKDVLESLAKLEHISGKPVLTDLFELFAGESYSKLAGSPKLASAAGASLLTGNPLGLGYLAMQSPALIKAVGKSTAKMTELSNKAIQSKLGKAGVAAGLVSLKDNPVLQSFRDKLKTNTKK